MPSTGLSRAASTLMCVSAAFTLSGCAVPIGTESPEGGPTGQDEERVDPKDVDTSGLEQGEIPSSEAALDEADLPLAEPPADAPLTERTAWAALREISAYARVADPEAESECTDPGELDSGVSLDCTVTYRGEEFEYHYAHRPDGSVLEPVYTAPVLRSVVEDDLRIDEDTEYVSCDMEKAEPVLNFGETPRYRCTYLDPETGGRERVEARVNHDGTTTFLSAE